MYYTTYKHYLITNKTKHILLKILPSALVAHSELVNQVSILLDLFRQAHLLND